MKRSTYALAFSGLGFASLTLNLSSDLTTVFCACLQLLAVYNLFMSTVDQTVDAVSAHRNTAIETNVEQIIQSVEAKQNINLFDNSASSNDDLLPDETFVFGSFAEGSSTINFDS